MWNRVRISLVVLIAVVGAMATTPPAGGATARGATPDAGSRWTSHGPGGAEVSAVAIDPRTPSTLVATTAAGVFRTFDGGATWQGASRGLGQDDWIPQIAVAPSQPRVLYAVRGWPHPALFRSSDRAGSWRLASEKLKGKPQAAAVDPRDAHVVYAAVYATPHKLFKSIDGGRHWRASDDGIDEFASIAAFAIDPSRPATIYAAGGGIYKSVNAGASWTRLPTNGDFASIAVGHDRPNLLYAAERSSRVDVSNDGGATWHVSLDSGCRSCWSRVFIDPEAARTAYASSGRLYKTVDGGATWTPLANLTSPVNWIAVDPSDSSHVYAGTSESQVPAFIGAGAGVYESADGGMTWAPRGRGLRATFELSVAAAPSHPGTVYAGGSSGVARSLDDGRHWVRSSGGLPDDLYVDDLAVDPTDARTVYAASGNHGLWATTDGGGSWQARNEGLPGPWIISVAAEGAPSRAVFAATLHGLYRSTDGAPRGSPPASWGPVRSMSWPSTRRTRASSTRRPGTCIEAPTTD